MKSASPRRTNTPRLSVHDAPKAVKLADTESGVVVAGGWRAVEDEELLFNGYRASLLFCFV